MVFSDTGAANSFLHLDGSKVVDVGRGLDHLALCLGEQVVDQRTFDLNAVTISPELGQQLDIGRAQPVSIGRTELAFADFVSGSSADHDQPGIQDLALLLTQ